VSVTIRAKLPKDDRDGLSHLESVLAADPNHSILAVVLLQTDTIEDRPHDDETPRVVKCVFLHVEPLFNNERDTAFKLLHAAYEARTGKVELPFEDGDGDG
jgi:hypothetical protein